MNTPARLLIATFCILHSAFFISRAAAQQLPPPDLTTTATTTPNSELGTLNSGTSGAGDEVVNLSVFNVTGSKDVGYAAYNTTSGSRLKTNLKDTAASISPFTEEFLNDMGLTTVDELITYAGNAESDVGDASAGFNNSAERGAAPSRQGVRIRGIAASIMADYAEDDAPIDMYNMSRAEISSGPNSILFGMGSQGGIINYTRKTADLRRNKLTLQNTIGTWTSPAVSGIPYERATLDYNLVLIPRALALRLNALYQDGDNTSWRYWQFAHDRRISPTVAIKPWQHTTINLAYEGGRRQDATTRAVSGNAADNITPWLDYGRPLINTFGTGQAIPNIIAPISSNNAFNHYVHVNNNNTMYNFRQAYTTINPYTDNNASDPTANVNNQIRLPSGISSYYYNTVGPAGRRDQRFENWSAAIQQDAGNFNFELGYYHTRANYISYAPNGTDGILQADPNVYVSPPTWNSASTVVLNPAGQPGSYSRLYMEDYWMQHTQTITNDDFRLTTNYNLDTGSKWWGHHRIINLLEHTQNETRGADKDNVLLDAAGQGIANTTQPYNNQNYLTVRQYVTEGDYRTYYDGDPRTPVRNLVIGDRTFHSAWVTDNNSMAHIKRASNSIMLALQSWWLGDKLTTTIGGRVDDVAIKQERLSLITNPADPRILNGSKAYGEYDFNGHWTNATYNPFTFTAGGVWHATNRISPFINYSTNRGLPYVDGRTVLPTGGLPPLTEGRSLDYGLKVDLTGNGKWTFTLTRFEVKQLHDTPITPAGMTLATNAALGASNLYNIYDALYFLTPTGQTSNLTTIGAWPAGAGPGAGPMTAAQYSKLPLYNAGETDVHSKGYELELVANPTKSITIRLTASYTDRNREQLFNEIFTYYNQNVPIWLKMADPNHNGGYKPDGVTPAYSVMVPAGSPGNYTFSPTNLYDYIWNQVYSPNPVVGGNGAAGSNNQNSLVTAGPSVRSGINDQLLLNSNALNSRPYKFNLVVRYKFPNDFLKGLSAGAGVRYQSFCYIPNPMTGATAPNLTEPANCDAPIPQNLGLDPNAYSDPSRMLKGNSLLFWDAFATYKRKILGGKTTMTIQFNINNIFNADIVTVGRYLSVTNNITAESSYVWRRVYLNQPRSYRLTLGFDF